MAEEVETACAAPQPQSQSHPSPSAEQPVSKQVPAFTGFNTFQNGDVQMFPLLYPTLVPNLVFPQTQEQINRGPGLYAVPVAPFMGPISGFQPSTLIPLTYSVPTRQSNEAGTTGEGNSQGGQQQQAGQQRPVVVRRFQIAIQLDLLLIVKLAAVIFLFNQDGSRQRLAVLVFFASLVYLYQTGALAPLVRWLSQGMQRAAAHPHPPRAAVRAENMPAAEGQGNENVILPAEGRVGAGEENRVVGDGNQGVQNENAEAEPGAGDGANRWWVVVKEIQMIVFGFISSLLPGFHNID